MACSLPCACFSTQHGCSEVRVGGAYRISDTSPSNATSDLPQFGSVRATIFDGSPRAETATTMY